MRLLFRTVAAICSTCGIAGASVIYDGTLNTTPDQQGWVYLTNPFVGNQAVQGASGGATTLDTTARTSDQAGYFGTFGTLDRTTGFTVGLSTQLLQETHLTPDRAGFSLIVVGSGLLGIELGFWPGQIWAQNVGFTHGEGAAFDTTQAGVHYDLSVQGGNYALFANGTAVLSGALRDYSGFGTPYNQPNLIFLGDDTTSASARAELGQVTLSFTPVPEPPLAVLLGFGLAALRFRPRTRPG